MLRYTLAMSIRVACLILAMVVQGWLMWVFFAGAILLPYFAYVFEFLNPINIVERIR
ncbi:MAG: hypothetical protein RL096_712, partial [Actinomycetota bacterium]